MDFPKDIEFSSDIDFPKDDAGHSLVEGFRGPIQNLSFPRVGAKAALARRQIRFIIGRDDWARPFQRRARELRCGAGPIAADLRASAFRAPPAAERAPSALEWTP